MELTWSGRDRNIKLVVDDRGMEHQAFDGKSFKN